MKEKQARTANEVKLSSDPVNEHPVWSSNVNNECKYLLFS